MASGRGTEIVYLNNQRDKWDLVHSIERLRLKYPSEQVVRFIKSNFSSDISNTRILDLGCGSGRHVAYLLGAGYQVAGMDISQESVACTQSIIASNGWSADVVQGSMTQLPYKDQSFDGLICHGVLLYLKVIDIQAAINEMFRVMKPGARALIVVRSVKDMRYGKGDELGDNTFLITDNFTNEEGMVMHFFTEEEIRSLFASFTNVQVGISEMSMKSLEDYNSDYIIIVTK
ncbi:class I SAM-dependent methyltransferase [Cohnella sp. AR92]|uniref:class I SAM-dependent methyltransferase n=1 Tax=Cohnella sp. AR92 TaxID=648716 RepID=UPI002100DD61|nr:class I SAM-dependent methyltransferase [Cohnella sp. AR92]